MQTTDPHSQNEGTTNNINSLVYDTLVQRDKDLNLEPALAVSWQQVNPTTWSVKLRPGVQFLGEGALTQQMWASPAVAVLGIDAPSVAGAAHQIVPWARAGISVRLAPGDNAERAFHALREHLRRHAPWNAEVIVTLDHQSQPHLINASGPAFDAFRRACTDTWGSPPVQAGSGGSLPLVGALTETYPDMAMLLTGVDDPESKAHAENESVHLGELKKCCVSEALLLGYLAAEIS